MLPRLEPPPRWGAAILGAAAIVATPMVRSRARAVDFCCDPNVTSCGSPAPSGWVILVFMISRVELMNLRTVFLIVFVQFRFSSAATACAAALDRINCLTKGDTIGERFPRNFCAPGGP